MPSKILHLLRSINPGAGFPAMQWQHIIHIG